MRPTCYDISMAPAPSALRHRECKKDALGVSERSDELEEEEEEEEEEFT